jgi:hypothetical protein
MATCEIWDFTGPKVRVYSQGQVSNAVGTVAVTQDAWVRIETRMMLDASNGIVEAKLFNSPDISTSDDTITLTGIANTQVAIGRLRFGINDSVTGSRELWMDSIAIETASYLGPYSVPQEGSTRRVIIA